MFFFHNQNRNSPFSFLPKDFQQQFLFGITTTRFSKLSSDQVRFSGDSINRDAFDISVDASAAANASTDADAAVSFTLANTPNEEHGICQVGDLVDETGQCRLQGSCCGAEDLIGSRIETSKDEGQIFSGSRRQRKQQSVHGGPVPCGRSVNERKKDEKNLRSVGCCTCFETKTGPIEEFIHLNKAELPNG